MENQLIVETKRYFNLIKNITKDTSNYKPGHLIDNLIVRQEIENQCKEKYEFGEKKGSILRDISKIGKKLEETQYNSLFKYDYILKEIVLTGRLICKGFPTS